MRMRSSLAIALVVVGLLVIVVPALAASANVLKNGSFEDSFAGGVGASWTAFNNGGQAAYGYAGDESEKLVYDGNYSQLIRVHTLGHTGSDRDRYSGIYQVVDVAPDERYMFSFYGMVRSTEGTQADSGYGYRIEVGFDYDGGTDPWSVTEWKEMDRWAEYPLDTPGAFQSYAHGVTSTSNQLTVFIRAWKKFPTTGQEGRINLDAVSLLGPAPGEAAPASEASAAAEAKSSPADSSTDTAKSMPDTGVGGLLPLLGAALGLTALGLTSSRLLRRR